MASSGRPRARSALIAGITTMTLMIPVGWAVVAGSGSQQQRLELAGGGAWLASPGKGFVTLIDGPSDQVVATVRAPSAGAGLSVTQSGASAFVADDSTGMVTRIDGATYQTSAPVPFGDPQSDLSVLAGGGSAFVVDATSRVAKIVDPDSLSTVRTFTLAARPGLQQRMVGADGRLWTVDAEGSGLNWFDPHGGHGRADADRTAQLVMVAGRPALVGVGAAQPMISWLNRDGSTTPWACHLPSRSGDTVDLLGSATGHEVFAAVSQTGTLVIADESDQACGDVVKVGIPGAVFGSLVQSGRFVFVPNRTTGATVVVDTRTAVAVSTVPLTMPGHQLQLVAKDGLVFYNDLDSEKAGVLQQDSAGGWIAGRAIQKYNPETGSPSNPVVSSADSVSPVSLPSGPSVGSRTARTAPRPPSPSVSSSSASPAPFTSASPPPPPPALTGPGRTTPITTASSTAPILTTIGTPTVATPTPTTLTTRIPTTRTVTTPTPTTPTPTTPTPTTPTTPTPISRIVRTPVTSSTVVTTPTVTPVIVDIVASGALSTGSSASFTATVDHPSGTWHWTATSDTGASLGTGATPGSFGISIPASGVSSVTVTLAVGASRMKSRTFPVVVAQVATSIDASSMPANIWDDFTIDPAVTVTSAAGASTPTGTVILHVHDPNASPADVDLTTATLTSGGTAAWDSIQPAGAGTVTLTFRYSGDRTHQAASSIVHVEVSTEALLQDSGCRKGDVTLGEDPSDAYLYALVTPDSGGRDLSVSISGTGFHGGPMTYRRPGTTSQESEFDFRVNPSDYSTTKDYDVTMIQISTGLSAGTSTSLPNYISAGTCLL